MEKENRIGLSLSGGGYRAAVFHLGTLRKLNEFKILEKVEVVSTISGGSITGACYALHQGDYDSFHNTMKEALEKKNVIHYVYGSFVFIRTILFVLTFLVGAVYLTFTSYSAWAFVVVAVFLIIILKYQFVIFPVSKVIEKAYDKFFYKGKQLKDLKIAPILAVGSSNLETGRPFTFSRDKMSDSSYSYDKANPVFFNGKEFPVARAVMASSCVPFAFTPVTIAKQFYSPPESFDKATPMLVDGGVYDNQGIQKLTQKGSDYLCDIIITSDAGGNFRANEKYPNTVQLLIRTVDLFMYRIKAFQMQQHIYQNTLTTGRPIAYFSLGWKIENLIDGFIYSLKHGQVLQSVIDAHHFDPLWLTDIDKYKEEIRNRLKKNTDYDEVLKSALTKAEWKIAKNVGTNLTTIPVNIMDLLIRQAENLTHIQVKLYCPFLIT